MDSTLDISFCTRVTSVFCQSCFKASTRFCSKVALPTSRIPPAAHSPYPPGCGARWAAWRWGAWCCCPEAGVARTTCRGSTSASLLGDLQKTVGGFRVQWESKLAGPQGMSWNEGSFVFGGKKAVGCLFVVVVFKGRKKPWGSFGNKSVGFCFRWESKLAGFQGMSWNEPEKDPSIWFPGESPPVHSQQPEGHSLVSSSSC